MSLNPGVQRTVGSFALVFHIAISGCAREVEISPLNLPIGSIAQEIRIGSLDEPGYALTRVNALEVATDGRMYSLHTQEAQVLGWSPAGEAIAAIGRRGEGPGEFTAPILMGLRADSLWVFDRSGSHRISFFDLAGTYIDAVTPAVQLGTAELAMQGIYPARPAGLLGDGTIHGVTPAIARDLVDGKLTSLTHVRMRRDGSVIDTVITIPLAPQSVLTIDRGGGRMYTSQPFEDGVLNTLTRDGQAFVIVERPPSTSTDRGEFRLHRVDLDGDTAYSRSYPYVPVRILSDTIDSFINGLAARLHRYAGEHSGTTLARSEAAAREAMYNPEFYPPVSELVAGRDGTIWLARSPPTDSGIEWLVLDGDGELLGTVVLPAGFTLMTAERAKIWGTERDEFDVDYIVRYRVRWADQ